MRSVVIDANLLVLLVVGLVSRDLIGVHKRTRSFEPADFDLLLQLLNQYQEVIVTPNVMTEASNLASHSAEPTLSAVRRQLAVLAQAQREEYRPSASVVGNGEFLRLGLTDCSLLDIVADGIPLVTADLDLYLCAVKKNNATINFAHIQQRRLLTNL